MRSGSPPTVSTRTTCSSRWARLLSIAGLLLTAPITLAQTESYTPADLDAAFVKDTLVIHAAENACYRFDVWLATVRDQQMRGLMFVRDLPGFTGMLFVYDRPGRRSMWMKNTYISLDIVFVRADGVISSIVADAVPLDLTNLSSTEPLPYVLELGGGVAAKLGITAGDRVDWSGLSAPEDDNR